jgi:hypothetical protein
MARRWSYTFVFRSNVLFCSVVIFCLPFLSVLQPSTLRPVPPPHSLGLALSLTSPSPSISALLYTPSSQPFDHARREPLANASLSADAGWATAKSMLSTRFATTPTPSAFSPSATWLLTTPSLVALNGTSADRPGNRSKLLGHQAGPVSQRTCPHVTCRPTAAAFAALFVAFTCECMELVLRLGWVGLGWVGLGWVGLGWVGFGFGFGFSSGRRSHQYPAVFLAFEQMTDLYQYRYVRSLTHQCISVAK